MVVPKVVVVVRMKMVVVVVGLLVIVVRVTTELVAHNAVAHVGWWRVSIVLVVVARLRRLGGGLWRLGGLWWRLRLLRLQLHWRWWRGGTAARSFAVEEERKRKKMMLKDVG